MTHHEVQRLLSAFAHEAELDGVRHLQPLIPHEGHLAAEDEKIAGGATRGLFQTGGDLDAGRHGFEIVAPLRDEVRNARLAHAGRVHRLPQLHRAVRHAQHAAEHQAHEDEGQEHFEQREAGAVRDA